MAIDVSASTIDHGVLNRLVPLERCANFRDVGGYETSDGHVVQWRRIFRSMTPEYMTREDVDLARSLGIRLVVDLRGRHIGTSGPIGEVPARRVAVGGRRALAPTEQALQEYIRMHPADALPVVLERMGHAYARAASEIANESNPALVHCRLGKDRTGVFIAVLLRALGVQADDVIDEYMLSGRYLAECKTILAGREPPSGAFRTRIAKEAPRRSAIKRVLSVLEGNFGGAEAYLRHHGMRLKDVVSLRQRLLI